MTCSEDRKIVRKFLEDLLEEAEYQRVRRHLENCAACTQFAQTAGSVSSMLMEMGRMTAAGDLVDNIVFQYEKSRRKGAPAPEDRIPAPPAPPAQTPASPAFSAPPRASKGTLVMVTVFIFLVIGLAWRDWVQTRLLEDVLRASKTPAAAAARSNAGRPTIAGDFEWGNVHVHWSDGTREGVSGLVRSFSPDIRYEAPGLLVARIDAADDAAWRDALRALPGVTFEEGSVEAAPESDRLYTIEYQGG